MLTNEQVNALVVKMNAKVNLPILGEKAEAFIFRMAGINKRCSRRSGSISMYFPQ